MKNIKFLACAALLALGMSSCNLNFFPSDELSTDVLLQDPAGAEYIMDGCYAMLKEEVDYETYASGNAYIRYYTQLCEFPSDNTCLSGKTEDPLYESTALMMTDNLKNIRTPWMIAYKVIAMANTVIETLKPGANDHLLGEAYFTRAIMHFHMVTLCARPYAQDPSAPGIPLRISTNSEKTERGTVAQVYEQVAADLEKAAELMNDAPRNNNHAYPCKNAALGLLTRVYLYMEQNDKVISTFARMGTPQLESDFANYFANAQTSKETLWCIGHTIADDRGQGGIGSMYNGDGGGWGEIYPSDPLLYLYERYPMDIRYTAFIVPQPFSDKMWFTFPDPESTDEGGHPNLSGLATPSGDNYTGTVGGAAITIVKTPVNGGEYFEYHVNYKGNDCLARVTKQLANRNTFPKYFVTKFGYQGGSPTLSSPVMSRWGEVILNVAEAYAKKNDAAKTFEYVNMLRTRAGIPFEGLFNATNKHGYDVLSASPTRSSNYLLNIVLDERRLELAFEGYRVFDVYRNKLSMDRHFPGCQPWAIIDWQSPKIINPIPDKEWQVSGIAQNPSY